MNSTQNNRRRSATFVVMATSVLLLVASGIAHARPSSGTAIRTLSRQPTDVSGDDEEWVDALLWSGGLLGVTVGTIMTVWGALDVSAARGERNDARSDLYGGLKAPLEYRRVYGKTLTAEEHGWLLFGSGVAVLATGVVCTVVAIHRIGDETDGSGGRIEDFSLKFVAIERGGITVLSGTF